VYIEFRVTTENPLFLVSHILHMVESEIKDWAIVNQISYSSKRHKDTYRVGFDDERHFTVFRLTWRNLPYVDYKIIDNKW
jgi:hypothetical protein